MSHGKGKCRGGEEVSWIDVSLGCISVMNIFVLSRDGGLNRLDTVSIEFAASILLVRRFPPSVQRCVVGSLASLNCL